LSVKQGFYAKILTSNLTAMMANIAQKKSTKQYFIVSIFTKLIFLRRFEKRKIPCLNGFYF